MSDEPRRISPSQIDLGRTCLRRWWRVYVNHEREPQAASAETGEKTHLVLEDYLNGKGEIDQRDPYGRIAYPGLKYLPPPLSGVTEGEFRFDSGHGFDWLGKIDWRSHDWTRILDHKTTSNFKYRKKEDVLEKDPQAILYALRALQEHDKPVQKADWIYYRTKDTPDAKLVSVELSRAHVAEQTEKLVCEVQGLIKLRTSKFMDLPPNPDSCYKYNKPCPFRGDCTDLNKATSVFGDVKMPSKDELMAMLQGKTLGPAGPPVVAPVAPAAPPPVAAATALPPASVPPMPAPSQDLLSLLTPSQVPAAPAAPAASPVTVESAPVGAVPGDVPEAGSQTSLVPATETPSTEPKKRGRPPGSKNKPRSPVVQGNATLSDGQDRLGVSGTVTGTVVPAADPAVVVPKSDATPAIGILYIDCFPLGESPTNLSEIINAANAGIKGTTGLDHYSLAEYGKGPALLRAALEALFSAYSYGDVYVDSSTPDARNSLDVLISNAVTVVRGIR